MLFQLIRAFVIEFVAYAGSWWKSHRWNGWPTFPTATLVSLSTACSWLWSRSSIMETVIRSSTWSTWHWMRFRMASSVHICCMTGKATNIMIWYRHCTSLFGHPMTMRHCIGAPAWWRVGKIRGTFAAVWCGPPVRISVRHMRRRWMIRVYLITDGSSMF